MRVKSVSELIGYIRTHPNQTSREIQIGSGAYTLFLFVALWRLERSGIVHSRWLQGPYPRRRVYRLCE